ncbi:hypothetical protein GIB67_042214 [Kingdonia uniflora]|uniref:Uncharacterized protein n=1 Tax=Kingdonia uniflora TaxID=39325 RepID=A0A7J7LDN8_9MAGN|nr:hypothetical protein GIB67_042214 [Kingdonia uniflora]
MQNAKVVYERLLAHGFKNYLFHGESTQHCQSDTNASIHVEAAPPQKEKGKGKMKRAPVKQRPNVQVPEDVDWFLFFAVKNDCVFGDDLDANEINIVSEVLKDLSCPILYSLSPGTSVTSSMAEEVSNLVNIYRITGDDWDTWCDVEAHFNVSRKRRNRALSVPSRNSDKLRRSNAYVGLSSCKDHGSTRWVIEALDQEHERICWKDNLGSKYEPLFCLHRRKSLLISDEEMIYKQQYDGKLHLLSTDDRSFA